MTETLSIDATALLRLLQLSSPSLPVGAFAWSQGLEWAVETGWVRNEAELLDWLSDVRDVALAEVELPLLLRMQRACAADKASELAHWVQQLHALRETAELRHEERQRGRAMRVLLSSLDVSQAHDPHWRVVLDGSQLAGHALACSVWGIDPSAAALAWAWGTLENLCLVGVKLVPLGQSAGQRIVLELGQGIPAALARAQGLDDDDLGASLPALAIASSRHETQYTRLFRS